MVSVTVARFGNNSQSMGGVGGTANQCERGEPINGRLGEGGGANQWVGGGRCRLFEL